ncbi:YdcF family protein [Candidatus Amesbacteria bacterium]|nr:YdcF family protein [Candidatus Amesbacteria bacterium]
MNFEKLTKHKKEIAIILGIALVACVAWNYTEFTIPALTSAFNADPISCTTAKPAEIHTIAILGSGSENYRGDTVPDLAMRNRLDRVTTFIKDNKIQNTNIVILSGKSDPRGLGFNSNYLRNVLPHLNQLKINEEFVSTDTPTNIDQLKIRLRDNDSVTIITSKSHLARAMFYACSKGLKAIGVEADDVSSRDSWEKLLLVLAALFDKEGVWATNAKLIWLESEKFTFPQYGQNLSNKLFWR